MRQSVLSEEQARFLREEKESLAGMQVVLAGLDLPRESLDSLQKAILQLDELFLIVVAGEFNAGKSALVNALLGGKVLPEGATPTTSPELQAPQVLQQLTALGESFDPVVPPVVPGSSPVRSRSRSTKLARCCSMRYSTTSTLCRTSRDGSCLAQTKHRGPGAP